MSAASSTAGGPGTRTMVLVRHLGVGFLVLGVLGFLPVVTERVDQLAVAGPTSPAALLGVLPVTVSGNVVHLVLGLAGVLAARSPGSARSFLVGGGGVYVVLCVRSLVVRAVWQGPLPTTGSWTVVACLVGLLMVTAGLLAAGPRRAPVRHAGGPLAPPEPQP